MLLLLRTQVLGHQLAEHPTRSFQLQNLLMAIGSHSRLAVTPFPGTMGLICQTL